VLVVVAVLAHLRAVLRQAAAVQVLPRQPRQVQQTQVVAAVAVIHRVRLAVQV